MPLSYRVFYKGKMRHRATITAARVKIRVFFFSAEIEFPLKEIYFSPCAHALLCFNHFVKKKKQQQQHRSLQRDCRQEAERYLFHLMQF